MPIECVLGSPDSWLHMRIAFQMPGDGQWVGGDIYLQNLFHALTRTATEKLELCVIPTPGQTIKDEYARLLGINKIITHDVMPKWGPAWVLNAAHKRFRLTDQFGGKSLIRNGVDVFFGSIVLFKYSGIGTLSWLPDFQHVHLPDMFTDEERRSRDEEYLQSIKSADRVVLLSEAVKTDLAAFAPKYAAKARVLQPISYIPESVYETDQALVVHDYELPEKFAYMPNQFWRHKNHEIAFRALKLLRDKGMKITVVCTGYPGDYRSAGYFASLWEKISQWNLREQVVYLGMVSRERVLSLIRQSICVINPSLFEGWGLSVAEATSIGKRAIISDIPAHREQNPPGAVFFDPRDCDDLAQKLAQVWCESRPGPDLELESEARRSLPDRIDSFAGKFVDICNEVCREVPA
jgi:glycosyltransferase involved in cell wall biosynthesis